jgi:AcrR family transcriptional regulator
MLYYDGEGLMPKKPTTTREEMIEGAFLLIRKNGYEAFSARNLAAFLGCSTQPVMYQFPNLEELKEMAYRRADGFHTEYIMSGESLLEIGLRYIQFAAEEPCLFRFLFQSGRFSGLRLEDLIRAPEVAPILGVAGDEEGLTLDEAAAYFEPLCVAVHGYASLIANNGMDYDPATIERSLTTLAEAIIGKDENQ